MAGGDDGYMPAGEGRSPQGDSRSVNCTKAFDMRQGGFPVLKVASRERDGCTGA